MSIPLEHDYIGLSEASLMERSPFSSSSEVEKNTTTKNVVINYKETELRLRLPGSESPERKAVTVSLFGQDLEDKNTGLTHLKNIISGAKRGFSDASVKWDLSINARSEADLSKEEKGSNNSNTLKAGPSNEKKAQVVGWPPIRSFRKNTLATNSLKNIDAEGKSGSGSGCLYVKVSMDGAPYLRKVDIKIYSNYAELSSALEKMFSCFSIGQCTSDGLPGQEKLSDSHLTDLLNGSEFVLTYEDKDGDWMLVGDVPWEMFIDSCKRLRIMKSSEAIGLAPRVINKCKNQT